MRKGWKWEAPPRFLCRPPRASLSRPDGAALKGRRAEGETDVAGLDVHGHPEAKS